LDNDSPLVGAAVARALGTHGNPKTIPKLARRFADDRHAVDYMAAASVIRLDAKNSGAASTRLVSILRRILDPDCAIRNRHAGQLYLPGKKNTAFVLPFTR